MGVTKQEGKKLYLIKRSVDIVFSFTTGSSSYFRNKNNKK